MHLAQLYASTNWSSFFPLQDLWLLTSTMASARATPEDVELADIPTDSVSSLAFSGKADYLAVGSWDNSVRIYEVSCSQGQRIHSQGRAMYNHNGPVLTVCWNEDGTQIFSGSTDTTARIYDIASGQSMQIAQHTEPVKTVKYFVHPQSHSGILVTGSWDKTLKYWDPRAPTGQPIYSVTLPDNVHDFDVKYPYLVVGTSSNPNDVSANPIHVFHLDNPTVPYKSLVPPMKKQLRALACFTGLRGTPSGSRNVLGAGGTDSGPGYIEDRDASKSYSFKCHRQDTATNSKDQALIYAVNDVAFHPQTKILATCGSDGVYSYWNLETRTRVKTSFTSGLSTNVANPTSTPFAPSSPFNVNTVNRNAYSTNSNSTVLNPPITSIAFNASGNVFAYAVSYDWHKGYIGNTPGYPNKVFLKRVTDEDLTARSLRR
ncbi:hypothetical protein D9758_008934 [Tetrapyrgos nigripes]|uniref:Anaphase-promoting complex subunit 4-like WD40 domain-containing protein n=1 Tax=Tetrapyrgos nigripes TaxID=182062 RepID=A0A8H5GKW7_9AGAR|nr:hypothetical protein D9758_008934 [Tetrapyrgos nigripes]